MSLTLCVYYVILCILYKGLSQGHAGQVRLLNMIKLETDQQQQQTDDNGNGRYLIISGGDGLDSYMPLEIAAPNIMNSSNDTEGGQFITQANSMCATVLGHDGEYYGSIGVPNHGTESICGGNIGNDDNINHLIIWKM